MKSKLMTKNEILEYVTNKLKYFSNINNLTCYEIGDGNINYVFRVIDIVDNRSIIVKQSDILLRSSGRPLDVNRSRIEADTLNIEYNLFPDSVPKIYFFDIENSLIFMEDISDYKNLRKELMECRIYTHLPNSLSDFVCKTLIPTTDLVIGRKEKN